MSDERRIESIVAADVGSTLTHVCLLDLIEGTYRFVAHAESASTLSPPEDDITIGLRRAIRQLERITQRPLLDEQGDLITPEQDSGAGVDVFVATSSAAPPLQCLIVGLTDDLSLESARRACSGSNALAVQALSLSTRSRRWDNKVLSSLSQAPADVVLMVGGTNMGPTAPLESAARILAAVYAETEPERRPVIVFAGNEEARRPVASIMASLFDFRVVENVRPDVYAESLGELQRELGEIYSQTSLAALPGYRRMRRWCVAPVLATTEALSRTLRFIARRNGLAQGVLGVDIGGTTTYVGVAGGETYQWINGAALGTSFGIDHLLELSGMEDICRWLPVSMESEEIMSCLENARLRPHGIPQTKEDLFLTHALVRQALLLVMRRMRRQNWRRLDRPGLEMTPAFDLIAARGGAIAHTPQDGLIALTLLDAIQPTGLARLVVDWASIWPQLGLLADVVPLAAAQVLERDSFRELGTLIAPIGEARDGEPALHIRIIGEDGQVTEEDVPAGTIRRLPLALSEDVVVEVLPSRDFDIGLGQKGLGGKARVRGGSLGIVVDTRGRPLSLPQDPELRRAKLQEWLGNLIQDANSG